MLIPLLPLLLSTAAALPTPGASAQIDARRVEVSFAFAGRELFLWGRVPAGTRRVVSVMEGPPAGPIRLMEKGRVAIFWLGVRQYRLSGMPGLYLVDLSCPLCNGLATCRHAGTLEEDERILAAAGWPEGPAALRARARLALVTGELREGERERVLSGFYALEERRGLYGVKPNAVRLDANGSYYHTFRLPAAAPDGRYRVTTAFLGEGALLGEEENELLVRKTGVVDALLRLSERRPFAYGSVAVLIAVASGWLAGTLFGRGGH